MKKSFYLIFLLILHLALMVSCLPDETVEPGQFSPNLLETEKSDLFVGQRLFRLQCSRCHGIEGGGGSAPSLKRKELIRAKDDAALATIISNGIPGTEMPGTWLLSERDIQFVVQYVRSLGHITNDNVRGNIDRGKDIYLNKGACTTCHIIDGSGGSLGPDLSKVGTRRSPDFIRKTLLTPGFAKSEGEIANTSDGFINNLLYELITRQNEKIIGMRINEDAFSIQIKDAQNRLHSFRKEDLLRISKLYNRSLMPGLGNTMTSVEIDDLVAFLVNRQ